MVFVAQNMVRYLWGAPFAPPFSPTGKKKLMFRKDCKHLERPWAWLQALPLPTCPNNKFTELTKIFACTDQVDEWGPDPLNCKTGIGIASRSSFQTHEKKAARCKQPAMSNRKLSHTTLAFQANQCFSGFCAHFLVCSVRSLCTHDKKGFTCSFCL